VAPPAKEKVCEDTVLGFVSAAAAVASKGEKQQESQTTWDKKSQVVVDCLVLIKQMYAGALRGQKCSAEGGHKMAANEHISLLEAQYEMSESNPENSRKKFCPDISVLWKEHGRSPSGFVDGCQRNLQSEYTP
jgi:hypothetical protein